MREKASRILRNHAVINIPPREHLHLRHSFRTHYFSRNAHFGRNHCSVSCRSQSQALLMFYEQFC